MADFKERLAKSQAKMDEVKAKIDDAAETAKIAGMLTKDKIDEQIDSVKGDINAGAESARLAAEKGKSKFNSALLKAHMSIESAKASIAEKKEAHDKAAQENRILDLLDYADLAKLVDYEELNKFRKRSLNPERPVMRGSHENGDIFFQHREASNPYYNALPAIVEKYMGKINEKLGTDYQLFNYYGAPDADRVIIAMGSICDVAEARNGRFLPWNRTAVRD